MAKVGLYYMSFGKNSVSLASLSSIRVSDSFEFRVFESQIVLNFEYSVLRLNRRILLKFVDSRQLAFVRLFTISI